MNNFVPLQANEGKRAFFSRNHRCCGGFAVGMLHHTLRARRSVAAEQCAGGCRWAQQGGEHHAAEQLCAPDAQCPMVHPVPSAPGHLLAGRARHHAVAEPHAADPRRAAGALRQPAGHAHLCRPAAEAAERRLPQGRRDTQREAAGQEGQRDLRAAPGRLLLHSQHRLRHSRPTDSRPARRAGRQHRTAAL